MTKSWEVSDCANDEKRRGTQQGPHWQQQLYLQGHQTPLAT